MLVLVEVVIELGQDVVAVAVRRVGVEIVVGAGRSLWYIGRPIRRKQVGRDLALRDRRVVTVGRQAAAGRGSVSQNIERDGLVRLRRLCRARLIADVVLLLLLVEKKERVVAPERSAQRFGPSLVHLCGFNDNAGWT